MGKYFSVLLVICSLCIYSDTQAQTFGDLIKQSIAEADQEKAQQLEIRLRDGSKLAPTLIPKAKNQSQLGSYLVKELTILNEAEKNKQRKRNKSREIRRIERDLGSLDAGIDAWERGDYSSDLNELTVTLSKHTTKNNNLVAQERDRLFALEEARLEKIAAAEKAEQERLAAEKAEQERLAAAKAKAELEKLTAYKERCEGNTASNDPFAAFNTTQEPRMDLVLSIGSTRMKLQGTKNGSCMWLAHADRPEISPALLTEESYQQNPNNKSQYSLTITQGDRPAVTSINKRMRFGINADGRFVLDFENYRCALAKADGSQVQITCDNGRPINPADIPDIVTADCAIVDKMFRQNRTAFANAFGRPGVVRLADCNIPRM